MRSAATHDLDRLLCETPFVRSLARALAGQDADDVVQDGWVRAMECSSNAIREARGWLACVVRGVAHNLRRSQRRRQALENATARADLAPSPAELLERQELRREMLDAVDALPEAQRTVVLLRHFEGLTPQRIAQHLSVPVSTVESRLRTAHANLRRRLDARHGGRDAWLIPLLPVRNALTLGGLGMLAASIQSKILVGVGAMLLATLAFWNIWDSAPPSPQSPDGTVSPVPLATSDHQARLPGPADDASRQSAVVVEEPPAPATTGTLIVKAVFGSDDAAIPDLLILALRPGSDWRFGTHRVRTDAAGVARFENISPGSFYVTNARNPHANARANVVAGEEVGVQLDLPAGLTITGVVVDRLDIPVPDADVCLAGLGALEDAEVATTTGANGRFELRGCRTECVVGARAAGHRSSEMQRVMMKEGGVRDLRLVLPALGGTVVGTVRSPEHLPIADAVVAIGAAGWARLDTTPDGALRAIVRTDANGQFRAAGLPAGEHPIQVRATRFAPWTGACRVETSAETPLDVTLGAAVSCVGEVVDIDGKPVSKAIVEVGEWDDFEHVKTRSAEDGSFRCDGLPPGAVEITGRHEVAGTGRVNLTGAAGEIVRCKLHLTPGLTLQGRVLTEDGTPIARATIDAQTDTPSKDPWGRWVTADADGRFAIVQCPDGKSLTIAVYASGFRSSITEGIDPHRGELVVRLTPAPVPSAFIVGTIVTPDGRPVPQAELEAHARAGDSSGLVAADVTGAFAIGPLPPGTWSVWIRVPDQPTTWTEWREVGEGAKCDLGKIWLPVAGTIRVRLHAAEDDRPTLGVSDATLAHWTGFSGKGSERRSEPLAPGLHYVSVTGDGVATRLLPVDVRAGEEQSIDIEAQRGQAQEFEIVSPAPMDERHIRVLQNGKLIAGESYASFRRGRSGRYRCNLTPGVYTITVTGSGMSGEASPDFSPSRRAVRVRYVTKLRAGLKGASGHALTLVTGHMGDTHGR